MARTTRTARLRVAGLVAAAATALVGLTACADDGTGTGTPTTEGESQEAPTTTADSGEASQAPADEVTEITWWSWSPDTPMADTFIKAFNEEHPNIKVTYKQHGMNDYDAALRTALAANSGPDIFAVSASSTSHPAQVFGQNAIDITPYLEEQVGADWKDEVSAANLSENLVVDGKFTGVSVGAVYSGNLWINKDLFDKYSVKVPTNYDEWKQACATFESNGVGCLVAGAGQAVFNLDWLHAIADNINPGLYVKATKGEAKWTDPDLVQAFTEWKALFDDGIVQEGALGMQQYPDANNAFLSQQYAMIMMGTWFAQNTREATALSNIEAAGVADPKSFQMVPIKFPDLAGTGTDPGLAGDLQYALAVNAASDKQEAAATFAIWMGMSDTGQQIIADSMNNLPALKSVTPNWESLDLSFPDNAEAIQELYQWAADATQPRVSTIPADLSDAIQFATTTVAGGDATPEQAMATLQQTADSIG